MSEYPFEVCQAINTRHTKNHRHHLRLTEDWQGEKGVRVGRGGSGYRVRRIERKAGELLCKAPFLSSSGTLSCCPENYEAAEGEATCPLCLEYLASYFPSEVEPDADERLRAKAPEGTEHSGSDRKGSRAKAPAERYPALRRAAEQAEARAILLRKIGWDGSGS